MSRGGAATLDGPVEALRSIVADFGYLISHTSLLAVLGALVLGVTMVKSFKKGMHARSDLDLMWVAL
jgi:hypothetical protein